MEANKTTYTEEQMAEHERRAKHGASLDKKAVKAEEKEVKEAIAEAAKAEKKSNK